MIEMEFIPLKTSHIIQPKEDLIQVIYETLSNNKISLQNQDILLITEKVVALSQGRVMNFSDIKEITEKAKEYALQYKMDPREIQIILNEADRIFGGLPGLMLTEKDGLLIANAGIDQSNAGGKDRCVLWPSAPYETAYKISQTLQQKSSLTNIGIIISDSRVHPMRRGVIGVAIGVAGFLPLDDCRGRTDLFGRKMQFTTRAVADQLADGAHVLMGECDEQTPMVLIRNAPVQFRSEPIDPKIMQMPFEQDLFMQILGNMKPASNSKN
jgi:coenzyme F420-0:L-glutamate ligase